MRLTSTLHPCSRLVLAPVLLVAVAAACGPPAKSTGPDPRIAKLWDDPAVCGAPAYKWVHDDSLGSIVDWQASNPAKLSIADLTALTQQAGIKVARPFEYDVLLFVFRYVTQDRGKLTQATGSLAVPIPGRTDPHQFPLLDSLHGTSGFNDACAPSASLGGPVLAGVLASLGYIVVAPDYIGMNGIGAPSTQLHPYLVAEPTAIASLDAVRAARNLLGMDIGVDATAKPGYLLFGGSQGGHAVLFTARYAPYYLPEEKLIAASASVPPADVLDEAAYDVTHVVSGTANTMAVAAAYADWYHADLSQVLKPPFDTSVPQFMQTHCGLSGINGTATTLDQIFTPAFMAAAANGFPDDGSTWSCILRASSLMDTTVARLETVPTLFMLSQDDTLVNTPIERKSFDTLCGQGMEMQYLECAGVGHAQGAVGSIAEQTTFLDDRNAGKGWPASEICKRTAAVTCSGTSP